MEKKKTRILYQRFLSLKRTKRSSVGEDAIVEGRDILILLLVLRLVLETCQDMHIVVFVFLVIKRVTMMNLKVLNNSQRKFK